MSSIHQVTTTLDRTGQVVRRGGEVSSDRADNPRASGSKRPMRDRLGSNVESSSMSGKKRHRGDGGVNEDDLRLKLMRTKLSQQLQTRGGIQTEDLHERLSKKVRSPARYEEVHRPEPREDRVSTQVTSLRTAEHLVQGESSRRSYSSVPMDSYRSRSPYRMVHDYRGASPSRNMDRRLSPQRTMDRRVSPPRNMDRRVSPPRNMEDFRRIPARRPMEASRGSPPPRNFDELRQVPTRTIDDSRRFLPSNGVFDSRAMRTSSVNMQASMGMSKPLTRMPPPTNGMAPRSIYELEVPLSIVRNPSSRSACIRGYTKTNSDTKIDKSFVAATYAQESNLQKLLDISSRNINLLKVEQLFDDENGRRFLITERVYDVRDYFLAKLECYSPDSNKAWWFHIERNFWIIFRYSDDIVRFVCAVYTHINDNGYDHFRGYQEFPDEDIESGLNTLFPNYYTTIFKCLCNGVLNTRGQIRPGIDVADLMHMSSVYYRRSERGDMFDGARPHAS